MEGYSTVEAAKKLGISMMTMHRYMRAKKIPVPKMRQVFGVRVRIWTEDEVEHVRKLLPKIANGRKTRYQRRKNKQQTQARAPALQKTKKQKTKKKKKTPKKK